MDCDIETQRAFFHTSDFDEWGSKQFGPHLMESEWYDLVGILLETLRADEMKEMGEIVRKGNTGAMKHERSVPDLRVLDSRIDRSEAWKGWSEEGADKKTMKNLSEDILAKFYGTRERRPESMERRSMSWSRKGANGRHE